MAIIGKLTSEGLTTVRNAIADEGWYIYPTDFAVSETRHYSEYSLVDVNAPLKRLVLSGDVTTIFKAQDKIWLNEETTRKGVYTIDISTYESGADQTTLEVREEIADIADPVTGVIVKQPVTSEITDTKYWFKEVVSSKQSVNSGAIDFICTIPPADENAQLEGMSNLKEVKEIYFFAQDNQQPANKFLIAIGWPESDVYYDPTGSLTFRLQMVLDNIGDTLNFKYTQATEIGEHNLDPNAHPDIQAALQKAGLFVHDASHEFRGQYWDEKSDYESGVSNNKLVYKNSSGNYDLALADGSEKSKVVGITFQDDTKLYTITSGLVQTSYVFDSGKDLYLSSGTAGAITDEITPVKIGLSLGNGLLLLGTVGGGGSGDLQAEELQYTTLLQSSGFEECYYDIFDMPNTVTLSGSPAPVYSSNNSFYEGSSGAVIEQEIVTNAENDLYRFLVHVESDEIAALSAQYQTDKTVLLSPEDQWVSFDLKENITVLEGFKTLKIKITWNGAGNLYSFGVLYQEANYAYTTDTRMLEYLPLTVAYPANTQITLPNNAVYTENNKSLEIYLNGARLTPTVDYDEVNNQTVKFKIALNISDKLIFTEKFGYVDTSIENHNRINLQHNDVGEHILTDEDTGQRYKLSVKSGELILKVTN